MADNPIPLKPKKIEPPEDALAVARPQVGCSKKRNPPRVRPGGRRTFP
jgi:hypothetical protein